MRKSLMILIAITIVGCNRERTVVGKMFLPAPCLCEFSYARLGSGQPVFFEDSCKFYKIGDVLRDANDGSQGKEGK